MAGGTLHDMAGGGAGPKDGRLERARRIASESAICGWCCAMLAWFTAFMVAPADSSFPPWALLLPIPLHAVSLALRCVNFSRGL